MIIYHQIIAAKQASFNISASRIAFLLFDRSVSSAAL